ncbi:hypothetical protein [Nocardioides sp. KR10-350]|uniref:hypothetical protein n=1 Tax=Nocardioides cheoyonin TaxID=3156615 RepID=UPI0032B4218F
MTWDDGTPHLRELATGVCAYIQPEGGWMVNNCGVITEMLALHGGPIGAHA